MSVTKGRRRLFCSWSQLSDEAGLGQREIPPVIRRVVTTYLEDVKTGKSNAPDYIPAGHPSMYSRCRCSAEVGDRIEENSLFRALGQSRTADLLFRKARSSARSAEFDLYEGISLSLLRPSFAAC